MSGDYNNLLAISCTMVDNCNILSGFDEFQQFRKGHDGLDYVDSPHSGTQNRREDLYDQYNEVNESWEDELMLFGDDESDWDDEERDDSEDEYYESEDYRELYKSICSPLKFVLNNQIAYENKFTKADVKIALMDIVEDDDFWDDLDEEVPRTRPINENMPAMNDVIKSQYEQMLENVFNELLENGIKFSKYDVRHAFLQVLNDTRFWNSLDKYIPEE